ncbi:MAG: hypothetical protein Q4C81_09985 [Kocuria sp.]|nr:hypothetical protein [Kocuria sp.]MDO4255451.1 hypothetical protein [Kocuria sp.]
MVDIQYLVPEKVQLPLQIRIRTKPWAAAFVVAAVFWSILLANILGIAQTNTPIGGVYSTLGALAFIPMCFYLAYAWMAWRVPRHLTVDKEGIRTHSWQLRWTDVESIWLNPSHGEAPDRKTQVGFIVEDHAWTEELRKGNRWDSGNPLGLGGMKARAHIVQTQFATDPPIQSALLLFEYLRSTAREEQPDYDQYPGTKPHDQ